MLVRRPLPRPGLPPLSSRPACLILPPSTRASPSPQASRRQLHARVSAGPTPKPTPFVPDAATFLTLIGRGLSQFAPQFPTWDSLFNTTSAQLKSLGVEPARNRRYLLRWREKYRHGDFGVAGNARFVNNGKVEVRSMEMPGDDGKTRMVALNVPSTEPSHPETAETQEAKAAEGEAATENAAAAAQEAPAKTLVTQKTRLPPVSASVLKTAPRIKGVGHENAHGLYGPHVKTVKGTQGRVGVVEVKEGMWEHKRGHKVDGGERRQAEVRFKRRVAERKKARA